MNSPARIPQASANRADLGLFNPGPLKANVAHWKISGYGASIIIWTVDEWDRLTDRPTDAQYYPCGVWCALRMD